MNHTRLILGLGSLVAGLAIGGAVLAGGFAITQRSEVMYMTDGPSYADLTELTKAAQAVAHVRVLSAGTSYVVPFDAASTVVSTPPTDNGGPKDRARGQAPTIPAAPNPSNGVLKTDFTVEVLDTVRGGLKKGDHLVVSQLGGTLASKRPDGVSQTVTVANAEHDALMEVGSEEIVFLNQEAASGKFFTTGGGLGRFKLQANGTVLAVDHESPLARVHNGKPAASLKAAVQAVR